MPISKENLGEGGLDPEDALALSAAFAAIQPPRRRRRPPPAPAGQGWADPSYRTLPMVTAEREIERLTQIAADMHGA